MKKIIIILSILMMLTGCSAKEEENNTAVDVNTVIETEEKEKVITHITSDKKETVYAKADASGRVYRTEVEVILKSGGGKEIEDRSNLTSIRNTHSDESFTQNGETLIFEDKGEDIHYKGVSTETLPVSVEITYTLDGKEIAPKDLAGKSGKLTMRFSYTNNTSKEANGYELIEPYLAMSVVLFDGEVFSNVEVENGKVLEIGEQNAVLIVAAPGIEDALQLKENELTKDISLKDYGVITADVSDFRLEYTSTLLSKGLFDEVKEEDLKKLKDMANDTSSFKKDAKELKENTAALRNGAEQLKSGIGSYLSAVTQLSDAAKQLKDASGKLSDGVSSLMNAVNGGSSSLETDLSTFTEQLITLETQAKTYEGSMQAMKKSLPALKELVTASSASEEEKAAILQILSSYEKAANGLPAVDLDPLSTALSGVQSDLNTLSEGMAALKSNGQALLEGTEGLHQGTVALSDGLSALSSKNGEVDAGTAALLNAAVQFDDGIRSFVDKDLNDLLKFGGSSLKELAGRIEGLQEIERSTGCFSGLLEGRKGESVFIIETDGIK